MTSSSSHSASVLICAVISVSIIAVEVLFKATLASTPSLTITTGFINSVLFLFLLTGISNFEMILFGSNHQAKLGEVILCLFFSCGTAALIHRVSVTTCFLFSILALYYVTRISARYYGPSHTPNVVYATKKRK